MQVGLLALVTLVRRYTNVLLWLHDPAASTGHALRHRIIDAAKATALGSAALLVRRSIVSIHPSRLSWVRGRVRRRVSFAPSGSNIGTGTRCPPSDYFTVSVFGSELSSLASEVAAIEAVSRALVARIGPFRLRILGASDPEHTRSLVQSLEGLGVICDAPGALPKLDLAASLSASHAFLAIRRGLTTRSGTLAAALSCQLPVVGFRTQETAPPLSSDGMLMVAEHDYEGVAKALEKLRDDEQLQRSMSEWSSKTAELFGWDRACGLVVGVLSPATNERIGASDEAVDR
jgi:hypothetical protein